MAHLRLIALSVAIGVAGCNAAGADGGAQAPVKPPPGWRSLPALASAAQAAAAGPGITVDGVDAWGDPSTGCYAVWMALHGPAADAPALAREITESLAAAKLETTDVVAPTADDGKLTLRFARGELKGRLAAQLGGGKVTGLACFANPREPATCDTACTGVLGAIP